LRAAARPSEPVRTAAALAADRKAADIVVLDLSGQTSVTDAFIICTGRSDIHVRAICQHIEKELRESGMRPISREGVEHGQWALIDYGDFVVHVFQPATRALYDLERLWTQAPRWTYEAGSAIEQTRA